jgi:outer membrane protein
MKIQYAIPALAALLAVPAAWGQANAVRAADAPVATKLGTINMQVAITGTSEGKQAAAELQSQFAPRETELSNMQKQIEDLQTRIRTTQNTASDDEKARMQREYDTMTRQYQRKQQDSQDDFQAARQEVVDRIGRKLIEVVDRYSKDQGYAVLLDTSSQQTPVIYGAPTVDVTQEVIRLYDQQYPVKAASTTPAKPAAPKPTTPAKPQQ